MTFLFELWLPIVVSAIAVFMLSSLIHMVMRYHMRDYRQLPAEQATLASMRDAGVPPGDYFFPHCENMADLANEDMQKKFIDGPVGMLTVMPSGPPTMGKQLGQWFALALILSALIGYVASITVTAADGFSHILRVVSAVTFLAYVGAEPMQSVWKSRSWGTTIRFGMDGLIYALATGAIFAWLWPG